eukprot:CAMPEP_0117658512 /NCGR_PEP_ID=MMETSP0804-20121206/5901_1 /TAXON_ID=1074897 /ORGANISM="Tetraselmis astigmatica, Strain CCMP880" /LENGTH=38 /DNA_ID= /DNA_START= /DNA_END= /DNA_ORIENTATION=
MTTLKQVQLNGFHNMTIRGMRSLLGPCLRTLDLANLSL